MLVICILACEGRFLETILKAEQGAAFRGSVRNLEGPGPRPAGTTTCPRGARCTDREEMPEKEARPPAQNRRSGAPRGAHARSQGCAKAPRKRLRRVSHTRPRMPRKHPAPFGAPLPLIRGANASHPPGAIA